MWENIKATRIFLIRKKNTELGESLAKIDWMVKMENIMNKLAFFFLL